MKKTKVIIPALGILLLSTAASVTGTVAWFATNQTVTATGMKITAKTDAAFMLIKAGNIATAAEIQADKAISANALNGSAQLYPAAHETVANREAALTPANWYYMFSNDPEVATGVETTKQSLTSFTDYVLVNEFSITVADGSSSVNNIKISSCKITTTTDNVQEDAVKVLVAGVTKVEEFSDTSAAGAAGTQVLHSGTVTYNDVAHFSVFIYWDGNDDKVFTNNSQHLLETSVELKFTGDIVAA